MVTRVKTEKIQQQIVDATDNLLYHRGFNLMSFSDIAEAAGVPRGNIYYYFKTKDEILIAVIKRRIDHMRLMLKQWETDIKTPLERLKRYSNIPLVEIDNVIQFGCPMGSLNTELGKTQRNLQVVSRQQYDVFVKWLIKQFKQYLPERNAKYLAMHLMMLTQGLAIMAQSYEDKAIVRREVKNIESWLISLETVNKSV